MRKRNIKTILFLSCLPFHHYIVKFLLSRKIFSGLSCVIVLHGDAESLTGKPSSATELLTNEVVGKNLLKRLLSTSQKIFFQNFIGLVKRNFLMYIVRCQIFLVLSLIIKIACIICILI